MEVVGISLELGLDQADPSPPHFLRLLALSHLIEEEAGPNQRVNGRGRARNVGGFFVMLPSALMIAHELVRGGHMTVNLRIVTEPANIDIPNIDGLLELPGPKRGDHEVKVSFRVGGVELDDSPKERERPVRESPEVVCQSQGQQSLQIIGSAVPFRLASLNQTGLAGPTVRIHEDEASPGGHRSWIQLESPLVALLCPIHILLSSLTTEPVA